MAPGEPGAHLPRPSHAVGHQPRRRDGQPGQPDLAFGAGVHYCLGAPVAIPEARIALQALYARLPGLRADLDEELEYIRTLEARLHANGVWRTWILSNPVYLR